MNLYDLLVYKKMNNSGGGDIDVESLSVTENGSYNAGEGKAYNPVIVNVQPDLITKSITANGTYQASSDNADGYSQVSVNVAGYKITDVSGLPSAIATFTDGANLPMPKLEVAIEPVQSGSGDPSPENIRPISGWDEASISVYGKNLANPINTNPTDFTVDSKGVFTQNNPSSASWGATYSKSLIRQTLMAGTYTFSFFAEIMSTDANAVFFIIDENDNILGHTSGQNVSQGSITITLSKNSKIGIFVKIYDGAWKFQTELGSNATSYEPYNGQTYTIDLDGTRYGGTLDVVSGVLTVTHGYIASYNGETLPSTWISDRDVYAEGTTPTIGAEVVYELATPLTIQLTPTAVKSLQGLNNVFADTGDVLEASYWESL